MRTPKEDWISSSQFIIVSSTLDRLKFSRQRLAKEKKNIRKLHKDFLRKTSQQYSDPKFPCFFGYNASNNRSENLAKKGSSFVVLSNCDDFLCFLPSDKFLIHEEGRATFQNDRIWAFDEMPEELKVRGHPPNQLNSTIFCYIFRLL